jgi:hypothetical protein
MWRRVVWWKGALNISKELAASIFREEEVSWVPKMVYNIGKGRMGVRQCVSQCCWKRLFSDDKRCRKGRKKCYIGSEVPAAGRVQLLASVDISTHYAKWATHYGLHPPAHWLLGHFVWVVKWSLCNLTAVLHITPRLRMRGVIPSVRHSSYWRGAWWSTGTTLTSSSQASPSVWAFHKVMPLFPCSSYRLLDIFPIQIFRPFLNWLFNPLKPSGYYMYHTL